MSPLCHSTTGGIYLIPTESTCQSHKAQAHVPLHNSLNLPDLNPTISSYARQLTLTCVLPHITYTHTYCIRSMLHPVTNANLHHGLLHLHNFTAEQHSKEIGMCTMSTATHYKHVAHHQKMVYFQAWSVAVNSA